jgi:hypothetical protein
MQSHSSSTFNSSTVTFIISMLMSVLNENFRGSPPLPPSYSAAIEKMPFASALSAVIRNRNFIIMFFVFSVTLGSALSLSVLMDEIVGPAGYTNVSRSLLISVSEQMFICILERSRNTRYGVDLNCNRWRWFGWSNYRQNTCL